MSDRPQTTHWEGCWKVHPDCPPPNGGITMTATVHWQCNGYQVQTIDLAEELSHRSYVCEQRDGDPEGRAFDDMIQVLRDHFGE